MLDNALIERQGVPTVLICSDPFTGIAQYEAEAAGLPNLPIVTVSEHCARAGEALVDEEVAGIIGEIILGLTSDDPDSTASQRARHATDATESDLASDVIDFDGDEQSSAAQLVEWRMADGLPIQAPTVPRVEKLLEGEDSSRILGYMTPSDGEVTLRRLAANAVMAGATKDLWPYIVSAAEAVLEDQFKAQVWQTTTHSVTPLVVVSGPGAQYLSTGGEQGPAGWNRNSAIQRTINLACMNLGWVPGGVWHHTFASFIKHSFALAENQNENPWESLSVTKGYRGDQTTVTVYPAEPAHHYENWGSPNAQRLLISICDAVVTVGCRSLEGGENTTLVVLCPEHAEWIAENGFSRQDVQRFIYENARIPLSRITPDHVEAFSDEWKKFFTGGNIEQRVPAANSPDDIEIVVAGGSGPNSLIMPCVTGPIPVTKVVETPRGNRTKGTI